RPPPRSPLLPYTTLFRSRPRWAEPNHPASLISTQHKQRMIEEFERVAAHAGWSDPRLFALQCQLLWDGATAAAQLNYVKAPVQRSEEHTSELQSRENLVC